jgi:uncharacterized membrane protein
MLGGDNCARETRQVTQTQTTTARPPPPVHELVRRRAPMRNVHAQVRQRISTLDKLAVWITESVGTMAFFLAILAWTVLWLGWNLLAPTRLQFDPPMGFVFWLFISNLIQILLMPLIMVGQNIQGLHSELRAESDLQVNIKAESEIEAVLQHLEYQNSLLIAMVAKLGIETPVQGLKNQAG